MVGLIDLPIGSVHDDQDSQCKQWQLARTQLWIYRHVLYDTSVYLHPEKSGDCMKIDGSIEDVCWLIAWELQMRCCHRHPRCAGCQVEDKRFNHAPKNGLRVFVAELAKVLDILRPQNKKKDKQPQLTTLCEDVWLHLYAYSISASVFYSTSCWNCWVQLAPIFSLFIIWYYRDIIGYNCIYLNFLTFSLCIYQIYHSILQHIH